MILNFLLLLFYSPLRILGTLMYRTEQIKTKTKTALGLVPRGRDKLFDSIPLLWWRAFTVKKYSPGVDCKNALYYPPLCVYVLCKVTLQLISSRDEVHSPVSESGLAS